MKNYIDELTAAGVCKFCNTDKLDRFHNHECHHDYDDNHMLGYFVEPGHSIRVTKYKLFNTPRKTGDYYIQYKSGKYWDHEIFGYTIRLKHNKYIKLDHINHIFEAQPNIINIDILSVISESNSLIECFDNLKLFMLYN